MHFDIRKNLVEPWIEQSIEFEPKNQYIFFVRQTQDCYLILKFKVSDLGYCNRHSGYWMGLPIQESDMPLQMI